MNNTRIKVLPYFGFGALAFIAIVILTVGIWTFYPYKTITFKNDPAYQTKELIVHQGDQTSYFIDYCKFTESSPTVKKTFEDGIVFVAEDTRAVLSVGCHTQWVPLTIPMTLPPGKYRLGIEVTYKLNIIRTETIKQYSNWFTVLRSETGSYGGVTSNTGEQGPQGIPGTNGTTTIINRKKE